MTEGSKQARISRRAFFWGEIEVVYRKKVDDPKSVVTRISYVTDVTQVGRIWAVGATGRLEGAKKVEFYFQEEETDKIRWTLTTNNAEIKRMPMTTKYWIGTFRAKGEIAFGVVNVVFWLGLLLLLRYNFG